jgi:hypothetical protein
MPTPAQLARRASLFGTPAPAAQPTNNSVTPPDATSDYQDPITEANGRISVSELRPGQWRAYLDGMTISKNGVNSWPTSERALQVARDQLATDDECNGNVAPVADKPKRVRRTKAQMEANAKAADVANEALAAKATVYVSDGLLHDRVGNDPGPSRAAVSVKVQPDVAVSDEDILADAFVTKAEESAAAGVVSRPANTQPATPAKIALPDGAFTVTLPKVSVFVPTLYVSCYPLNKQVRPIEDILAPLEDETAYEARVPYYGMIEYGKGTQAVTGKLIVSWHKNPPKEDMFISGTHPMRDSVVNAWLRSKGQVIVGTK